MDIETKKKEVQTSIASQPSNVVFGRIAVCDEIQLADLMKSQFTPYLKGAANSSHPTNSDSLHQVCINLAKQRALLQGAAVTDVMNHNIGSTNDYADTTGITFSILENSSYSNKTSIPYIVLHDLNEDGGIVTLSTTSDANTSITNDEGTDVKYFTDFSKYFMTRSRANGELVSIDENSAPYTTPTAVEPLFPANTINGETYTGDATDPTANTDVRHDFFLTPNTTAVGYAGANNDITENKYVGNTYVTLALSNVTGSFSDSETIADYDGTVATVKTAANTTTLVITTMDTKGTFTLGETLTDLTSNATIEKVDTVSSTEINITLTGSTLLTGSNTSLDLGFSVANTIALDTNSVKRTNTTVEVTANNHEIIPGEYIVLKGATNDYSEFNDTFIVQDITQNTIIFNTANSISVIPDGDFSLITNIVSGRTSNATAAIHTRTVNTSASIIFQSSDLSTGFPIGNTISGQSSSATGIINNRISGGAWYQTKTNEVKTFYIDTANDTGFWDYDATNNSQGMETSANTGEFWLKNFEMVKINQLVASSGSGGTFVAPKVVLDIAIATSSDSSGGYDSTIDTKVPGIYLAYPLKTYEDQVHDGITTLEAYNNFANIIVAPEGLEINFDWKPLANSSGVAINTTHITSIGEPGSGLSAYAPEECTVLDKGEFNAHLGAYENSQTSTNVLLKSANPDNRSSGILNDAGTSYDNILTNPMFPALSGKHKNWEDEENDLVGEQPDVLNANDIFAGDYTEIQTGATGGQYRYTIQNDLKWVYATNPKTTPLDAATSSGQGNRNYNVFGTTDWSALYDGYTHASGFGALINSIEDESLQTYSHTTLIPQTAYTTNSTLPGNGTVPPALDDAIGYTNSAGQPDTYTSYDFIAYRHNTFVGQHDWVTTTVTGTGTAKRVSVLTATDVVTAVSGGGSQLPTTIYTVSRTGTAGNGGTGTTTDFTFNVVQAMLNGANTVTFHTMLDTLQTEDNDSTFGAGYLDPNEPPTPIISDGEFDAAVNTMTDHISHASTGANTYHQARVTQFTTSYFASNSHNYVRTNYNAWLAGITAFQTAMELRITEISNRIGYLNGKDVADGGVDRGVVILTIVNGGATYVAGNLTASGGGGSGFAGTYTVNGGTIDSVTITNPGKDYVSLPTIVISHSGDGNGSIIATIAPDRKTEGWDTANSGFVGTTFNNGNGYANTIYSQSNFLAGKKIKLFEKILTAINDLDALYNQIKTKRAEYYEYNQ